MTWDAYERGERLTVHNATKKQLVWMVKDRDATINRQYKEIQELKKQIEQWQNFCVELVNKAG